MPDDLVITGLGIVTPLGVGVDATWRSLLSGAFVTDVGRVDMSRDVTRSRVAQLGLLAAREAVGSRADVLRGASLIVGTSKGPVDEWLNDSVADEAAARDAVADVSFDEQTVTATMTRPRSRRREAVERQIDGCFGLSTLASEIADGLGIANGQTRLTLSAACASGMHALARAALLLRAGDADAAIVVATESSLHPMWHGTFRNLGVLAPPGQPCRPLDENRSGFVMSEAAAAVLLERRPAQPGELVLETCIIASDATHLTGIDPTGRTLRSLIDRACIGHSIDFVHAHATATANDAVELAAIRATLGDGPAVYSHKGSIGHTLGASSLLAVAISGMIHRTHCVPAMPTTTQPLEGRPRAIASSASRSLCLAAGFGGALAATTLRTVV